MRQSMEGESLPYDILAVVGMLAIMLLTWLRIRRFGFEQPALGNTLRFGSIALAVWVLAAIHFHP